MGIEAKYHKDTKNKIHESLPRVDFRSESKVAMQGQNDVIDQYFKSFSETIEEYEENAKKIKNIANRLKECEFLNGLELNNGNDMVKGIVSWRKYLDEISAQAKQVIDDAKQFGDAPVAKQYIEKMNSPVSPNVMQSSLEFRDPSSEDMVEEFLKDSITPLRVNLGLVMECFRKVIHLYEILGKVQDQAVAGFRAELFQASKVYVQRVCQLESLFEKYLGKISRTDITISEDRSAADEEPVKSFV